MLSGTLVAFCLAGYAGNDQDLLHCFTFVMLASFQSLVKEDVPTLSNRHRGLLRHVIESAGEALASAALSSHSSLLSP